MCGWMPECGSHHWVSSIPMYIRLEEKFRCRIFMIFKVSVSIFPKSLQAEVHIPVSKSLV